MNLLNVYRCRGGGLLLSPNAMPDPLHTADARGLVGVGVIDSADLDNDVGQDVARQLAGRLFALLPDGTLRTTKRLGPSVADERA